MTKTPRKTTKASEAKTSTATASKPRKAAVPKPAGNGEYDAKAVEVLKGLAPRKRSATVVTSDSAASVMRKAKTKLAEAPAATAEVSTKPTRGRKSVVKAPAQTPAAEPVTKPKRTAKAKPAVAGKTVQATAEAPVEKAPRKARASKSAKTAKTDGTTSKAKRGAKPKGAVVKTVTASVKAPRKPRAAKPVSGAQSENKPASVATPIAEVAKPAVTETKPEAVKPEEARSETAKMPSILDNPFASAVRRVAKAVVRRVLGP